MTSEIPSIMNRPGLRIEIALRAKAKQVTAANKTSFFLWDRLAITCRPAVAVRIARQGMFPQDIAQLAGMTGRNAGK